MKEFIIDNPQPVIDDLHHRLAATRWTNEMDNKKWEYGTNGDYLKELCNYWQHDFDWKKQEAFLSNYSSTSFT
jgi:hypothetical protein